MEASAAAENYGKAMQEGWRVRKNGHPLLGQHRDHRPA